MTDATQADKSGTSDARSATYAAAGPQTARRRLMLGAAAVIPSIYTITSGAQTAVSSNRCLPSGESYNLRSGRLPWDHPLLTDKKDGWLRKSVYHGLYNGKHAYCALDNQGACVDGSKITNLSNGQGAQAASGSVWIVVDGTRVTVGPNVVIAPVSTSASGLALLFVDKNGTNTTLDPDALGQWYPVKESCWASILGNGKSMLG